MKSIFFQSHSLYQGKDFIFFFNVKHNSLLTPKHEVSFFRDKKEEVGKKGLNEHTKLSEREEVVLPFLSVTDSQINE